MKATIKATIEATYEVDLDTFRKDFKITSPMLHEALSKKLKQSIAVLQSHTTGFGVVEEFQNYIASLSIKLLEHDVVQTEMVKPPKNKP